MLKLFMTSLQSTMTEERLNGLAMMQYHRNIHLDPKDVYRIFKASSSQDATGVNCLNLLLF